MAKSQLGGNDIPIQIQNNVDPDEYEKIYGKIKCKIYYQIAKVMVNEETKVEDLKKLTASEIPIPPEDILLRYDDQELEDHENVLYWRRSEKNSITFQKNQL